MSWPTSHNQRTRSPRLARPPSPQHVVATLVLVDWIALELVYEAYAVRRVPADGPAAARRAAEAEVALELLRAVQLKQPALPSPPYVGAVARDLCVTRV